MNKLKVYLDYYERKNVIELVQEFKSKASNYRKELLILRHDNYSTYNCCNLVNDSKVFGSKSAIWFMDSVLKAKRIAFYVINKLKVTLVHYR